MTAKQRKRKLLKKVERAEMRLFHFFDTGHEVTVSARNLRDAERIYHDTFGFWPAK